MILTLLLLCVAGLAWSDTALGRALREALVQRPARKLAKVSRGAMAFWPALMLAGALAFLLFEFEGLRLFGMMAPETLTWFVTFDVGVSIDALIVAAAILSGRGWQTARIAAGRAFNAILATPRRLLTAVRASRVRRPRKPSRRPDESEPRPAPGQAAPYFVFSMAQAARTP